MSNSMMQRPTVSKKSSGNKSSDRNHDDHLMTAEQFAQAQREHYRARSNPTPKSKSSTPAGSNQAPSPSKMQPASEPESDSEPFLVHKDAENTDKMIQYYESFSQDHSPAFPSSEALSLSPLQEQIANGGSEVSGDEAGDSPSEIPDSTGTGRKYLTTGKEYENFFSTPDFGVEPLADGESLEGLDDLFKNEFDSHQDFFSFQHEANQLSVEEICKNIFAMYGGLKRKNYKQTIYRLCGLAQLSKRCDPIMQNSQELSLDLRPPKAIAKDRKKNGIPDYLKPVFEWWKDLDVPPVYPIEYAWSEVTKRQTLERDVCESTYDVNPAGRIPGPNSVISLNRTGLKTANALYEFWGDYIPNINKDERNQILDDWAAKRAKRQANLAKRLAGQHDDEPEEEEKPDKPPAKKGRGKGKTAQKGQKKGKK